MDYITYVRTSLSTYGRGGSRRVDFISSQCKERTVKREATIIDFPYFD